MHFAPDSYTFEGRHSVGSILHPIHAIMSVCNGSQSCTITASIHIQSPTASNSANKSNLCKLTGPLSDLIDTMTIPMCFRTLQYRLNGIASTTPFWQYLTSNLQYRWQFAKLENVCPKSASCAGRLRDCHVMYLIHSLIPTKQIFNLNFISKAMQYYSIYILSYI